MKKIFFIVFFISQAFFYNVLAQKLQPKITEVRISKKQIIEVQKNKEMQEVLAILSEDGDYIDFNQGIVKEVKEEGVLEIRFEIKTKVKGRVTEYKNIIYSRSKDQKVNVYFDEQKEVPANNPIGGNNNLKLFGCGGWSGWIYETTSCNPNFWCFGKNQQATYIHWYRTRQCNKGVQRQNKSVKQFCGC